MTELTLLLAALTFGGMTFFSFGFAPVLFAQLPIEKVRPLLRGTFPFYYLAVLCLSGLTAAAAIFAEQTVAIIFGFIFLTTVYARQVLMNQINAATDRKDQRMFNLLHGLSVVIQLIQIGIAGWAVVLLSG
ncbi:MAG: DUF4149 domain-containing protein [Pseudomonadota bacterium]